MPYDRDEYDKLAKGPVCRLDNGLVEVGGVYRARRPTIIYPNPRLDFNNDRTYYTHEVVKKGELIWVINKLPKGWTYSPNIFQLLYNEQIYYTSFSGTYLNKDGPEWERVE